MDSSIFGGSRERTHASFHFLANQKTRVIFRFLILLVKGVVFNNFLLLYLLSAKTGHRAIGYLEEEAVKTYTRCLEDLDAGKITSWSSLNANALAIDYWNLPKDAMFRDVLLAVRADECIHREVNHHFTNIGKDDQIENGMLYIMDKNKNNE